MCRFCLGYRNPGFDANKAMEVHDAAEEMNMAFRKLEKKLLILKGMVNDKDKIREISAYHKKIVRERRGFNDDYFSGFLTGRVINIVAGE